METITAGVLTWNCAGNPPPTATDISDVVLPGNFLRRPSQDGPGQGPPEIYVVGLQEMVDLEVIGSVMCSKDIERMYDWEGLIRQALRKKCGNVTYDVVSRKVMFGCYIMLFAREDVLKDTKLKYF